MRFLYFFLLFSSFCYAQLDSLKVGDSYWEDQLYVSLTYNSIVNQPSFLPETGFSYGLSVGYIKDIPFNTDGKWAFGIGAGYNYDSFNQGIAIDSNNRFLVGESSKNKLRLHNLEFPIQIRWRNSDINTYTFWRVYAGTKLTYNFSDRFVSAETTYNNSGIINKIQLGFELSAGYGTFNFYGYYGLFPLFKDFVLKNTNLDSRILKFGIIFYML